MESIAIINELKIERIFNEWKINIILYLESISFTIEDNLSIYESSFNIKNLQKFKLLSSFKSMNELADFFLNENNKIEIEKNNKDLNLIIISNKTNIENIKLLIHEKNKLCEEIIEKLIKEIKNIKLENKKLNEKLIKLENEIENEKKTKEFNDLINENRIQQIENLNNKNKIQLTHCNLKEINSFNPHNNESNINSILSFPSGNLISVSSDRSIKIYDNNFNIIQDIKNAHYYPILNCEIKNENIFATCSFNIKIWIKNIEKKNSKNSYLYKINNVINDPDESSILKILFCLNGNIISCSDNKKIKIWEEVNNNKYICIKILTHSIMITSILILQDKNILISSSLKETKFWNINSYENLIDLNNINCMSSNGLKRIDENRIIIGGDNGIINIISLNEFNVIFQIENGFKCWGICIIENKGIFLVGGVSKNIKIYRSDNYVCINNIENAHQYSIIGIVQLNDFSIVSYGEKNILKIWSF